jgi:hypothetical protein
MGLPHEVQDASRSHNWKALFDEAFTLIEEPYTNVYCLSILFYNNT